MFTAEHAEDAEIRNVLRALCDLRVICGRKVF